jgi:PPOX class probable F420-dependent enzyme
MSPELAAAGRRRYVSLTTFRRTGVAVATPVWIAPAGNALVVVTDAATGKAKRLRNNRAVVLRECDVRGRVRPGAVAVEAVAELVTDPAEQRPLLSALEQKYGWQLRAYEAVERAVRRLGRSGPASTVLLRITDRERLGGS